ncbi:hypothetical protein Y032_0104g3606 [Ancylostoma ceylanicum]|uniref:Helix-turn-helix domain-containing protein n=1 Tax=Ancylostoma ceylanicum TaxID=53326 RepID=A0A016TGK3_9BILA|nr:hypothetical protein Y032_0104g3606 [Ancylostoma ceylanicum]
MEVEATLEKLNAFDPHVLFTIERADNEGYLPFLNTKIRLSSGQKEYVWHKKAASANISVHSRSAHPQFIKANVVRNFKITKEKLCTATDVGVERKIGRILAENGYNGNPSTTATWFPHSTSDGILFILPYVGDRSSTCTERSGETSRIAYYACVSSATLPKAPLHLHINLRSQVLRA